MGGFLLGSLGFLAGTEVDRIDLSEQTDLIDVLGRDYPSKQPPNREPSKRNRHAELSLAAPPECWRNWCCQTRKADRPPCLKKGLALHFPLPPPCGFCSLKNLLLENPADICDKAAHRKTNVSHFKAEGSGEFGVARHGPLHTLEMDMEKWRVPPHHPTPPHHPPHPPPPPPTTPPPPHPHPTPTHPTPTQSEVCPAKILPPTTFPASKRRRSTA